MAFTFEALQDIDLMQGSYFMDFDLDSNEVQTALTEGKLRAVFGEPVYESENYENSLNYIVKATAADGTTRILTVYNMGVIHIGAEVQDATARAAAKELIAYVNAAHPADYERTVYYLDFDVQLDIAVKDGVATVRPSEMSEEKMQELIMQWYGPLS